MLALRLWALRMEKFEVKTERILEQLAKSIPVLIDAGVIIEAALQSNNTFFSKLKSYGNKLVLITNDQLEELKKAVSLMNKKSSESYNPKAATLIDCFIKLINTTTNPPAQVIQKFRSLIETIPRAVVAQTFVKCKLSSNMLPIMKAWKAQKKDMDSDFMRKLVNNFLNEAILIAAVNCTKIGVNQAVLSNEYRQDVRNKIHFVLLELLRTCSVQPDHKIREVTEEILQRLLAKNYDSDIALVATAAALNIQPEAVATLDSDVVWLYRFYLQKYAI